VWRLRVLANGTVVVIAVEPGVGLTRMLALTAVGPYVVRMHTALPTAVGPDAVPKCTPRIAVALDTVGRNTLGLTA